MKRNRVVVGLVVLTILAIVVLATHLQPSVICAFQQGDSIDEAACVAEIKLAKYDEDPEQVVDWLQEYHGEATGAQIMYSLANWTLEEPEKFLDLLSRVEEADFRYFSARVALGINDNGQSARFKELYGPSAEENERLRHLFELLYR